MLLKQYEDIAFHDGESVDDFSICLSSMVMQLQILGDPELADKVVHKYLRVAPKRFDSFIVSIEMLLDVDTHLRTSQASSRQRTTISASSPTLLP